PSAMADIGKEVNNAGRNRSFNGGIDEVAIYGSALAASRITAHYMAGAAPASNPNTYRDAILNDSPSAYYRLNEASGATASDASGNSNAGAIAGGVVLGAAGSLNVSVGSGMQFDGSTGYVTVPNISITPAITAEAWIYPTTNVQNG